MKLFRQESRHSLKITDKMALVGKIAFVGDFGEREFCRFNQRKRFGDFQSYNSGSLSPIDFIIVSFERSILCLQFVLGIFWLYLYLLIYLSANTSPNWKLWFLQIAIFPSIFIRSVWNRACLKATNILNNL